MNNGVPPSTTSSIEPDAIGKPIGASRPVAGRPPLVLSFGRAVCGHLAQSEQREWWIANGRGGYAGGAIAGTLTRRYHGLLVAPVDPPLGRRLILARADATLVQGAKTTPLFTNRWTGGIVDPAGHVRIESFRLDHSVPVWVYAVAGTRIEHRIWMEPGANTTYVAWRRLPGPGGSEDCALRVKLLANNRGHHDSTHAEAFTPEIRVDYDTLHVADAARFTLKIRAPNGRIGPDNVWYRNFALPAEAERGLDATDSHLCVGEAALSLATGTWCGIVASIEGSASDDLEAALERRIAHDRAVIEDAARTLPDAPAWILRLALAADAFVVARPPPDARGGQSVIAGYPWFGDWGRDTMVSLAGLTLATGRPETALRILRTFARFVSEGMLPNTLPSAGEAAAYNTADAALWYVEAWRAVIDETDDLDELRAVFPVLDDIIAWHVRGTRYGIALDPADGLLRAGIPGAQVTWMDAKVGDRVVTPRVGKPVEINALWFNALMVMAGFAARIGLPDTYTARAETVRGSFVRFVRPDGAGLLDVLDGLGGNDASIRPNQIFAVSLPHSPLDAAVQQAVVATCARHLLTSYGLRSLAPENSAYHRGYGGSPMERDAGYHQGPVWGWLLGPFALAWHRVTGDWQTAQSLLSPMRDALSDLAIGTIGEIFDGDPPHEPRGAPAQAWSVACTLDAWRQLQQARTAQRPRARSTWARVPRQSSD